MKWKSNAKFGQPTENGTIFTLKDYRLPLSIHTNPGYGPEWRLTCRALRIDMEELRTEDFNEAVSRAKELVRKRLALLQENFGAFVNDASENEIVRH